jgi:hypothetical protein
MRDKLYKGTAGGFVASLIFHAAAFFVAGLLVIFTIVNKPEPEFEPPPAIERPKMKLKKPKVKVRKSSQPKPSSRIVAKVKTREMPEIQLPDIGGVGDGLMDGTGFGDDIIDMPDFTGVSLFGSENSVGNDFVGHLYQLSHNRSGGAASMDEDGFRVLLREYVMKGWDDSLFDNFYRFPKKLYATHFVIPPIPSPLGPDAFGAPEMECYYMFAVYKGKLVYHKDIKFRFWGMGDAYLFVNVDGKEVLVNGWQNHRREYFDWWKSHAAEDNSYMFCNLPMSVGDWIELKAGEPVDMKVLFGEWKGGIMGMGLMIEVEGEDYPSSYWNGPLLPVFKTEHLTWDHMTEICKYLPVDECSLTNGPVFRDFESPPKVFNDDYGEARAISAVSSEEEPVRKWTFTNGEVMEAEFRQVLFDKVVLRHVNGQELSIMPEQLVEQDRGYIRFRNPPELDIEFSRKSRQRSFSPELFANNIPPEGSVYQFTAKIRQKSSTKSPYGFPLTVEFFAIGDQIMADKRVLLDRKVETFTLSEENDFNFNCMGSEVKVLDFTMNRLRRGTRYGGYLVVVRDTNGTIIAHKASSKNLYENLENLLIFKKL